MITDIYKPIDDISRDSLEKVHALVESNVFLAGLGQNCTDFPVPVNFPVITDMERSLYLLTSDEMVDEPAETRQDQFYADVGRFPVQTSIRYKGQERKRRKAAFTDKYEVLWEYLDARFVIIFEEHNIIDYLVSVNAESIDAERIPKIVKDVYLSIVSSHIYALVQGSYMDGFDTWPIANHIYACYQTGGITAGWVGPLPDAGGVAQDCMQLLHYGPQAKS